MLRFNTRGNLMAEPQITTLTTEEFFEHFVKDRKDNERRILLFRHYEEYTEELQNLIGGSFTQWIGGSFVSIKIAPKDIDLVNFISHEDYERCKDSLQDFLDSQDKAIHSFLVILYPPEHPLFYRNDSECKNWQDDLGHTCLTRQGKRFPKGFVQIIINSQ